LYKSINNYLTQVVVYDIIINIDVKVIDFYLCAPCTYVLIFDEHMWNMV